MRVWSFSRGGGTINAGGRAGAWFVQESWICDETFRYAESPRQSDLDIARGRNAKEVLEAHWDTWIQEDDWRWLRERGFNSVRIPVRVVAAPADDED